MRRGFTLVEVLLASGITLFLVYILAAAAHLGNMEFLQGEVSHALQSALVLGSELSDDLHQAVRDPGTGVGIAATPAPLTGIQFYRGLPAPGQPEILTVPVRWTLVEPGGGAAGHLVRVTFDTRSNAWDRREFGWASIPVPGVPGQPSGSNPFGFRLDGDGKSTLQSVLLTVLARGRSVDQAGARRDRATVQISVSVPPLSRLAREMIRPVRTFADLPAN